MNEQLENALMISTLVMSSVGNALLGRYWIKVWDQRVSAPMQAGIGLLIIVLCFVQFFILGGALGAFNEKTGLSPFVVIPTSVR